MYICIGKSTSFDFFSQQSNDFGKPKSLLLSTFKNPRVQVSIAKVSLVKVASTGLFHITRK